MREARGGPADDGEEHNNIVADDPPIVCVCDFELSGLNSAGHGRW